MRRMRHLKPREIQGCQLALDASLPGTLFDATSGGNLVGADGAVARWEDQSGNARHVTQATAARQPSRKVSFVNGRDSVLFAGGADNSANADFIERASVQVSDMYSTNTDVSLFVVLVQNSAQANNTPLWLAATSRLVAHLSFANTLFLTPAAIRPGASALRNPPDGIIPCNVLTEFAEAHTRAYSPTTRAALKRRTTARRQSQKARRFILGRSKGQRHFSAEVCVRCLPSLPG